MRVLVVDDDPSILETYAGELAADTHLEFALASSAREARVCLNRGPYDAFVVDLCLPDGDGIALVQEIRGASGENTPAILITAHDGPRVKADALRAGINEVIPKPVDGQRLRALLHALHAPGVTGSSRSRAGG